MSYIYTPNLPRKGEKLFRNAGILLGLLLFATSFVPKVALPWLLQLLATLFLISAVALQMLLAKSYSYRLTEDGLFEIEETVGRKSRVVCRISKSEIEAIESSVNEAAKALLAEPERRRYSYLGTLKKENSYWLFATVSEEKLAVRFFAEERLIALLNE
ncbi:MAG: hypothetical protein IJR88_04930 [Clostridia bacterium]|nr:hypothetical protein [Clostridia bacterium]